MSDIYENIKKFRLERGWSQEELAKRAGYNDRSSIAKIETGAVDLSQSKIILFANVFGVKPSDLLGEIDNQEYYTSQNAIEVAQALHDNPNLKILFDAVRDVPPEDIKRVAAMINAFKSAAVGGDDNG